MVRDDEGLFERYMDACLEGSATDPERFFAEHPELGADVRARIESLHRMMRQTPVTAPVGAAPIEADDDLPFERLGEYRLLRRLGTGGMGVVYLAEQESLHRVVALKVSRPELRDSAAATERFRREGLAVARLEHPHIVRILSVGEEQGARFLAMDLVAGKSLADLRRDAAKVGRSLPVPEVLCWIEPIARALHHAHEQGVVHRDVKPSNIRATPDGRPMLLDFGIARDEQWRGATLTHAFTGSPLYAAPEQLRGGTIDGRTDVYGLGVSLYECLTGRVPFLGENMEESITKTLHDDPIPPRQLRPALSRDLEVVTLKAIARRPEERYADADAFADDLLALIEGRQIRARPPSLLRRARRVARRHPAVATAAVMICLAIAAALVWTRMDRRMRAEDALAEAKQRLAAYQSARAEIAETEGRVEALRSTIHAEYMNAKEEQLYDAAETEVLQQRRRREEDFYAVLDLLRRAEQLDPALDGIARVRAQLFLEKWREAKTVGDDEARKFYEARVRALDSGSDLEQAISGEMRVVLDSNPSGAMVYLFRWREQAELFPGGERRMVPVPVGEPKLPVQPGSWCLRVASAATGLVRGELIATLNGYPIRHLVLVRKGAGEIRRGDRLVSIDGEPLRDLHAITALGEIRHAFEFLRGAQRIEVRDKTWTELDIEIGTPRDLAAEGGWPAEVYRDGRLQPLTLPRGLESRVTAIPTFTHPRALIGTTPLDTILPRGEYLALLRAPGRIDGRYAVIEADHQGLKVELRTPDQVPDGFVPITNSNGRHIYIMEREILASEYLEFLNARATLRRSDASSKPLYYPREPQVAQKSGYWPRDDKGRFRIANGYEAQWPVLGVSWDDATAYAEWRSRRDGRRYQLPSYEAWITSTTGGLQRRYPFGSRFRPKWIKSCYARPKARPEPPFRFPIDESPFGLYDTCGSVMEWLDGWYDESRKLRRVAGGSWAQAEPKMFELWGRGAMAHHANGEYGFRLMIVPEAK